MPSQVSTLSDALAHAEARAYNLNLYLAYLVLIHPALLTELEDTFDGLPGFAPQSLRQGA